MPPATTTDAGPRSSPAWALAVVAASTLLTMGVWFSATAVVPRLEVAWGLSSGGAAALTIAVQVGFVLGAVGSAVLGLADALPGRALMAAGALGAAACTAGLLLADGLALAVPLRLLTGVCLALFYPVALKEVSAWFLRGRGVALGLMIGALTLGSALPHLVGGLAGGGGGAEAAGPDWRVVVGVTSVLAVAGGLLLAAVRGEGPHAVARGPVSLGAGFRALSRRDVLLADLGYVGHMWELYAMWAGVGAFLLALPQVAARPDAAAYAGVLAFACIGVGALGCLLGGVLGDRWGRPRAALLSLVCSGGAALVLAASYPVAPLGVVVALCAFWGFWVIADSAQFSAMVTESAPPGSVGGALSVQLALGYATTTLTLWLVPALVDAVSWRLALVVLALGPAVGAAAMVAAERGRGSAQPSAATAAS
ncbi:MFS transporter [Nocardioides sp. Leaf374]|uniref:MFS transporter n=1 Tax=Nocardioides sp. Leaf374 TaxID=2876560 RepID=UPI001E2CE511|nr:MFS transporter [Nocardioides sp. Leaf374]